MDNSSSSSYTLQPESKLTLSTSQQITQKEPPETSHDDAAVPEDFSAAGFRLSGRSGGRRRRTHVKKISKDTRGAELTDEKDEVEKKIEALQKIVPGGERLPVEKLFEETAEYILALESQLAALRFLAAFVHGSATKKKMLGG